MISSPVRTISGLAFIFTLQKRKSPWFSGTLYQPQDTRVVKSCPPCMFDVYYHAFISSVYRRAGSESFEIGKVKTTVKR